MIERSHREPVVVDFWAEWCGPCRALGPILEEATAAAGVALAKLDTDANQSLSLEYGIRGIPAVKAFRNGHVVAEFVGAFPKPHVEAFLAELTKPGVADTTDDPELKTALECGRLRGGVRAAARTEGPRDDGRALQRARPRASARHAVPAPARRSALLAVKAIVFERLGGPEVMELREVPDPVPGDGEVLVDVEAAGINFRDVYERLEDDYGADPPAIMGIEGGGTAAGGERLAWAHGSQSYAERVAVTRDVTVPIPDGLATDVAVAALLQGMTAHYLVHDSYPIEAGTGCWCMPPPAVSVFSDADGEAARRARDRDHLHG